MVRQEMREPGLARLSRVALTCGALAGVRPEGREMWGAAVRMTARRGWGMGQPPGGADSSRERMPSPPR